MCNVLTDSIILCKYSSMYRKSRLKYPIYLFIFYIVFLIVTFFSIDVYSYKILPNSYRNVSTFKYKSQYFKLSSTDGDITSLFDNVKLEDILDLPKQVEVVESVTESEPVIKSEVDDRTTLSIYDEDTEANVWSLVLPEEFVYSASTDSIWGDTKSPEEIKPVRWSTRSTDEDRMRLGDIYNHLSKKSLDKVYKPIPSAHPNIDEIDKTFFIFDTDGYLRYYLEHLNGGFNPQIHKGYIRDTKTVNYLLNREYIQEFKRPFPPTQESVNVARDHLVDIIPSVLESLAESIRNDPNRECIPSPPYHNLKKLPPRIKSGEFYKTSEDYKGLCDLQGVHEPTKGYIYPYLNIEPLIDRLVMRLYLDLLESRDFGKTNLKKLYCLGKKKSAISGVYIEPGNGHLSINGRDGYQYLDYNEELLGIVFKPLKTLRIQRYFNVIATARGGGIAGQASAIFHALSTYIYTTFLPKSKSILRYCGLVTRDLRRVERKKVNMHKARRAEQYSKR